MAQTFAPNLNKCCKLAKPMPLLLKSVSLTACVFHNRFADLDPVTITTFPFRLGRSWSGLKVFEGATPILLWWQKRTEEITVQRLGGSHELRALKNRNQLSNYSRGDKKSSRCRCWILSLTSLFCYVYMIVQSQ